MSFVGNAAFHIGRWRVDPALDEISRNGKAVKLEPRTMRVLVSLADLDLGKPQDVQAARDRLQAAARRVCHELQTGRDVVSIQYSACVDETFAHALRQADLLQQTSADF